jgi:hypothetical protein
MAQLVFHHQDGDVSFEVRRAGYFLSPTGAFACSIECAANPDHDYMAAPCFALAHVPCGGSLHAGQRFELPNAASGEDIGSGRPAAYLYAGDHYRPWDTWLAIIAVGPSDISVEGSFCTTDPNYYDSRAKPTRAHFEARLARQNAKDLWWPF